MGKTGFQIEGSDLGTLVILSIFHAPVTYISILSGCVLLISVREPCNTQIIILLCVKVNFVPSIWSDSLFNNLTLHKNMASFQKAKLLDIKEKNIIFY